MSSKTAFSLRLTKIFLDFESSLWGKKVRLAVDIGNDGQTEIAPKTEKILHVNRDFQTLLALIFHDIVF